MRLHIILLLAATIICNSAAQGAKPRSRKPAKPKPEQLIATAEADFAAYRFDAVLEALSDLDSPAASDLMRRAELGANMLGRVEQLQIVDSVILPRASVTDRIPLPAECGTIFKPSPSTLPLPFIPGTTAYTTPDGKRYIYTSASRISGESGQLATTYRLVDGSLEQPADLGSELHIAPLAQYPYMLTDGITLYFAAEGDNSLGGLDIFMARNNGTDFLQPQNVGMPYNSPYDDYLMAIDETSGYGFWITDRNQIPDSVTLYVFRVNDVRRNYPADAPDISDRARITSIASSLPQGTSDPAYLTTYTRLMNALDHHTAHADTDDVEFTIAIPDRGIITSRSMLTSQMSLDALDRYLEVLRSINDAKQELTTLRCNYHSGDHSVADRILTLERQIPQMQTRLTEAANAVIRAESTQPKQAARP